MFYYYTLHAMSTNLSLLHLNTNIASLIKENNPMFLKSEIGDIPLIYTGADKGTCR